jgi:hypothetical protein
VRAAKLRLATTQKNRNKLFMSDNSHHLLHRRELRITNYSKFSFEPSFHAQLKPCGSLKIRTFFKPTKKNKNERTKWKQLVNKRFFQPHTRSSTAIKLHNSISSAFFSPKTSSFNLHQKRHGMTQISHKPQNALRR